MTREIGIIERAPMVRAILDGRKWQTRRVMKPRPPADTQIVTFNAKRGWAAFDSFADGYAVRVPYAIGDHLWVRETWAHDGPDLDACRRGVESDGPSCGPYYQATARAFDVGSLRWRSPIHMPKWATRIWLTVTDVRVQRVQEISEEDARAEGATRRTACHGFRSLAGGWSMDWSQVGRRSRWAARAPGTKEAAPLTEQDISLGSARMAFASYWNDIHGPDAWERNDWVVAVSFERSTR